MKKESYFCDMCQSEMVTGAWYQTPSEISITYKQNVQAPTHQRWAHVCSSCFDKFKRAIGDVCLNDRMAE